MVLVFFVYGLAFFSMGFAIALESRQSSDLKLARSLPYLAAFGILHSLVEWADMLLLIESSGPSTFGLEGVRLGRTLLLGASTVLLIQFGASLLDRTEGRGLRTEPLATPTRSSVLSPQSSLWRWLRLLPWGLGLAWVITLLLLLPGYPAGSRQWLIHADVWARFLLYLPGSVLAGLALFSEAGSLERADFRQIAQDARIAGVTFLLNAFVAGLVVPPGQHMPASPMDYDSFQALFGIPVQLVRALSALAITYFVLRVLRVFRFESARRMEEANRRQNLAALEERERIAREMHDGLAQVVGFLNLKTRLVQQLVASGGLEQAASELAQMQKIVQEAYTDIRQSILSLRTATELDRGLVAAIRVSVSDFTEQNGLPVELALAEEDEVSFPPEAEVQLVRIVQEALANVRKHSRATKVWIRLERRDGKGLLIIEDDGIGFDLSQLSERKRLCFGLQTMRERAESIGAHLEVTPIPGEGTRIQVRFPFERRPTETRRSPQNSAG